MAVDLTNQSDGASIPLYDLPEGCIAKALSLTNPRDACRLSLVGSTFRSASLSDDVWERFLPADYRDILSRSEEGLDLLRSGMSKKDLYLHLCDNPVLIDGGNKSFALDKSSGKKCYMLAARDISIVWSDTPAYWKWIPLPESRFSLVAELIMVCWLEIRGAIKASMLSPDTNYAAYLVFTVKTGFYGFDHPPAEASVGFSGQEHKKHDVQFDPEGAESLRHARMVPRWMRRRFNFRQPGIMEQPNHNQPGIGGQPEGEIDTSAQIAKRRVDGWMEVELGEIFIKEGEDVDVEMSLLEVKGGNWKSGLAVEGIEIRPKERK